jgi:hypothetical protein
MCDAVLDIEEDELDEGDDLDCSECGANLTVTSVDPLELAPADDGDDDDEDEDFDEDYEEDEEEDELEEEEEEEDWR